MCTGGHVIIQEVEKVRGESGEILLETLSQWGPKNDHSFDIFRNYVYRFNLLFEKSTEGLV